MAELHFTCPNTHARASSGIKTDAATLKETWSKKIAVKCPLCGNVHELSVRETYINDALIMC
jgi:transcription elongation factor Elf1